MSIAAPYPTVDGPFVGGFGMGVVQQSTPAEDKPLEEIEPIERPYSMYGSQGQFGGYGQFPILSLVACWQMRKYPMVRKVFSRVTEPVLSGSRNIEVVDDGGNPEEAEQIKKAAEWDLLPRLAQAMPGHCESLHFGRWTQEIVWADVDGRIKPVDMRPILPNEAIIMTDEYRQFAGLTFTGVATKVDPPQVFLSVNNPHMDPILGESLNEGALISWFRATQSAQNADAIERKASGIQLFMHIMEGVTIPGPDGKALSAGEFGQWIMNAAVKGQSVRFPSMGFDKASIKTNPDLAKIPFITIQPMDWGNQGPVLDAHLSRNRDLDVNICAAWGIPERAVMEAANHGGYADASIHADVVLCISEKIHLTGCQQWDNQVTRRWLEANFAGTKVKIRTQPVPLTDPKQDYLQKLVLAIAGNPSPNASFTANTDERKLFQQTGVPLVDQEEATRKLAEAERKQVAAQQVKTDQLKANQLNQDQVSPVLPKE